MPLQSAKESPGRGKQLKVFISYSRRDAAITDRLVDALEKHDIEVVIDRRNLPLAVEFQQELLDFIRQADTVVYVVSPASIASEWCTWEIEQVQALSKRLAPVLVDNVPDDQVPDGIRKINYVVLTGENASGPAFDDQTAKFARALKTDVEWLKEHTRLAELARRWQERARGSERLLRGSELRAAEEWSARQPLEAPPLTSEHRNFIEASRASGQRRQRNWMVGSVAIAMVSLSIAVYAFIQRGSVQTVRDSANIREARYLGDLSRRLLAERDVERAWLVALSSIPEGHDPSDRPGVKEAYEGFYNAWSELDHTDWALKVTGDRREPDRRKVTALDEGRRFVVVTDSAGAAALLDTSKPLSPEVPLPSPGTCQAFSVNGRFLIVGAEAAEIWDTESGARIATLPKQIKPNQLCTLTGDGTAAVTAQEGRLQIWDPRSGARLAELTYQNQREGVRDVALTEDGSAVFVALSSGVPWHDDEVLWRYTANEKPLHLRALLDRGVGRITADRAFVVALGGQPGHVTLYDVAASKVFRLPVGKYVVEKSDYAPRSRRLLTLQYDGTARVFDLATMSEILQFQAGKAAGFSPDERTIFATSGAWDVASGRRLYALPEGSAIWARDDLVFVTDPKSIWVVRHPTGEVLSQVNIPNARSAWVAGQRLFAVTDEDHLRSWPLKGTNGYRDVSFDGRPPLAVGFSDADVIAIVRGRNGVVAKSLSNLPDREFYVRDGVLREIHPNEEVVDAAVAGGHVIMLLREASLHIFDLATQRAKSRFLLGEPYVLRWVRDPRLALSADGRVLVVWSPSSPIVQVRLVAEPDRSITYKLPTAPVQGVIVSPTGDRFAVLGTWRDHHLYQLFETATGKLIGEIGADYPSFSADGKTVVSFVTLTRPLAPTETYQVWNAESGVPVQIAAPAAQRNLLSLPFSKSSRSPGTKIVPRFHLETRGGIFYVEGYPPPRTTVSPDGSKLIMRDAEDRFRVYEAVPVAGALTSVARQLVRRCLTVAERNNFFLEEAPPDWCIAEKKPPYDKDSWQRWLRSADRSRPESMPR